jgi:hypothetical protein
LPISTIYNSLFSLKVKNKPNDEVANMCIYSEFGASMNRTDSLRAYGLVVGCG